MDDRPTLSPFFQRLQKGIATARSSVFADVRSLVGELSVHQSKEDRFEPGLGCLDGSLETLGRSRKLARVEIDDNGVAKEVAESHHRVPIRKGFRRKERRAHTGNHERRVCQEGRVPARSRSLRQAGRALESDQDGLESLICGSSESATRAAWASPFVGSVDRARSACLRTASQSRRHSAQRRAVRVSTGLKAACPPRALGL